MISQRILAVFTAAFLVSAIAVGSLTEPGLPLGQLIFEIRPSALDAVQTVVQSRSPDWVWSWVVHPLLVRPAWLLPASLGIICGGICLTLASRAGEPRSRRKRS